MMCSSVWLIESLLNDGALPFQNLAMLQGRKPVTETVDSDAGPATVLASSSRALFVARSRKSLMLLSNHWASFAGAERVGPWLCLESTQTWAFKPH